MADQHEVPQLLVFDHTEDVGDVQGEIDAGTQQVRALAEAGQRRGEHDVSTCPQPVDDAAPGPAAMPGAVDKDEGLCVSGWHVSGALPRPSFRGGPKARTRNPEAPNVSGFRVRRYAPSRND